MLMSKFIKKHWMCIVIVILMIISVCMLFVSYNKRDRLQRQLEEAELIDSNNTYHKWYYEKAISDLKKVNKSLYDSISNYKDQVSYLIQFKYQKEYNTGKVETGKKQDTIPAPKDSVKTYQYAGGANDTISYNLSIGSTTEPDWYSLNVKVSDQFTIVNKELGNGMNEVTIDPGNNGNISDVTVFKKEQKRSFFDRFSIGPSVSYSYNFNSKTFGPTVGVAITYDLLPKKKKNN